MNVNDAVHIIESANPKTEEDESLPALGLLEIWDKIGVRLLSEEGLFELAAIVTEFQLAEKRRELAALAVNVIPFPGQADLRGETAK
jgi:hypothetical protein